MANYVAPPPPPSWDARDLLRALEAPDDPRSAMEYLHWDKLRHLDPPAGITTQQWWMKLKLDRRSAQRVLPFVASDGHPFTYSLPDEILRRLHRIDQETSGRIAMDEIVTSDEQARQHYLVNSQMEEAIRSSQLEGATTSRRMAKDLLQSGREPRDRSERMILNNHLALTFMREGVGDRLTPETVLELHRILTEGTLDNPDAAGRLQRPDEVRVAVTDRVDGSVLHRPPPAEELPQRLAALCDFANRREDEGPFIHPVVRAVILHFMLAYDHPFEDGNGRTARALFYWHMRTRGYWLTDYLSISRILRNGPSRYVRAFLLTETDEGDVTYFLAFHLEVIERAIDDLHAYLRRKMREVREIETSLRGGGELNHRQRALVADALRHPERTYTFTGHARTHGVTHETGRADLSELADLGLLERRRSGRQYLFVPPADLADRLKRAG